MSNPPKTLVLALTAAALLVGCAPADASEAATVVVDIYSGRENPTAHLTDAALSDLAGFIDAQRPAATASSSPEAGLGFRGFVVTIGGELVRVLHHDVFIEDDGSVLRIADDGGAAYDIVFADIRDELDQQTVDAIADE